MPRFEIDFLTEYTDEALIGELRRIAARLSDAETLTKSAYKRHSPKVAHSTIQRRFGGWGEALERAGLGHVYHGKRVSQKMRLQPGKGMSRAGLIAELQRVHALAGTECLTSDDFNALSTTTAGTVRNRFGTFGAGLLAASIQAHPNANPKMSDEQCFENIAEVWTHYGRAPQYREMFQLPSRIQGKTYVTRWGTWRKALRAFAEWGNSGDRPQESDKQELSTFHDPPKRASRTEADCREIRPGLRFKIFMRDRFRCRTCGRSPATQLNLELHADHILPVANGGKTTLENLQTLCQDCNLGKGRTVLV